MSAIDAADRAGYLVELQLVTPAVDALGYTSTTISSDGDANPELIVSLSTDEDGRQRTLRISFIPVGDNVSHTKFVQMWSPLPFTAGAATTRHELLEAVAIVNEHVALGRFGLQDDGTLYFRYILAVPRSEMLDDDMFGEIVAFCDYHQEFFGDYLEGVCEGEISVLVLANVISRSS